MRGRFRSLLVVLAASLILSSGEAAVRQASSVAPAAGEDPRLAIQREAASLLKQAARPGNTRDQAQRALRDAAQRLEALADEPDPPKVSNATAAHRLDPALRDELRRAASALAAVHATLNTLAHLTRAVSSRCSSASARSSKVRSRSD